MYVFFFELSIIKKCMGVSVSRDGSFFECSFQKILSDFSFLVDLSGIGVSDYGNCDNNTLNGCETNIGSTVAHCGACGNDCNKLPYVLQSTQCSDGKCFIFGCTGYLSNFS